MTDIPLRRKPGFKSPKIGKREFPEGYYGKNDGIYSDDGTGNSVKVCDHVEATDMVRRFDGGDWRTRFRFKDHDGVLRNCVVTQDTLGTDPKATAAIFYTAGLHISTHSPTLFQQLVKGLHTDKRGIIVDQAGFHGDRFVTPDSFTLRPRCEAVSDEDLILSEPAPPQKGGTLDGQRRFIDVCVRSGSDHIAIAPILGTAGTLVDFIQSETFLVGLYGKTSGGKTTTLKIAASASGPVGEGGRFASMSSTLNALERLAQAGSGSCMIVDEAALFNSEQLQRAIFQIASSGGKSRMTTRSELRKKTQWATVCVVSSENALSDEIHGAGGREARGGVFVRVLSIDTSDGPRLEANVFEQITEGYREHYGHVLPLVAQSLLDSTIGDTDARRNLRQGIEQKADQLAGLGAASHVRRSAFAFGLLWQLGEIYRELAITPADFEIQPLIQRLWDKNRSSTEASVDSGERGVENLIEALWTGRGHQVVDIEDATNARGREALAWYREKELEPKVCFYVPTKHLVTLAGSVVPREALVKELAAHGHLETPPGKGRGHVWTHIPRVGKANNYRLLLTKAEADEIGQPGAENRFKNPLGEASLRSNVVAMNKRRS